MRRADAAHRKSSRPDGVVCSLQVIANNVEPSGAVRSFSLSPRALDSLSDDIRRGDLLPEDDGRSAGVDELVEDGPEVALVVDAGSSTGLRERLTGRTARVARAVVRPTGETKRERPPQNAAKEVTLREALDVVRGDFGD